MASIKSLNGRQLLVQIGDGASSETFAHDCLINTERGIQFASESNREPLGDCDDPDKAVWSVFNKTSLSATISGAGRLHTPSLPTWWAWMNSDDAKNVRVLVNGVTGANGGGYWAGAFKLASFEVSGPETGRATVSVTLESDGEVSWVDAA